MRATYIVSYDIADQRRLRLVHRTMMGFGDSLQYSVFRCILSEAERILLVEKLTGIINNKEDQILFVNIGPPAGRAKSCISALGRDIDNSPADRIVVIV